MVRSFEREGGFKNDWNNPLNVNIQNCIDSIREITSRGGHVVRLGDATMQKLPKIRINRLPITQFKNPEMDIYLLKRCKFLFAWAQDQWKQQTYYFKDFY